MGIPQHSDSEGLQNLSEKQSERAKAHARNLVKKQAQKALKKYVQKQLAKSFIKNIGKKLLANAGKIFLKVLLKVVLWIISTITSFIAFLGWPVLIVFMALMVLMFLINDFNFDLTDDSKTIMPIYKAQSMKTIDSSKQEQVEWKVPTGLIASLVQMYVNDDPNPMAHLPPGMFVPPVSDDGPPPDQFMPIYIEAGKKYDVPWYILAAIHRVETSFSTDLSVSSAGAVGHMQFTPDTWHDFGVDANGDGTADPYDIYDAIYSTANMLHKVGANQDMATAILRYNNSKKYLNDVLGYAMAYKSIDISKYTQGNQATTSADPTTVVATPSMDGNPSIDSTITPEPARNGRTYSDLASTVSKGLEPKFTYKDFTLKTWQYRRHFTCGGGVCTYDQEDPPAPGQVVDTRIESKISDVDTWRGFYHLDWEITGDWLLKDHQIEKCTDNSNGGETCTGWDIMEKKEELKEKNREYSPNFNRLLSKFTDLDMFKHEIALWQIMYNSQVDPDSPEYTNQESVDLTSMIQAGGTVAGTVGSAMLADYQNIPPAQINGDQFMWPVPDIHNMSRGFFPGHNGIDITNNDGQAGGHKIYAAADGVVINAGYADGFGQAIYIDHGNGVFTRYGHTQWDAYGVKVGDHVKKGQYIGEIGYGQVGSSTGPHCHFEIIINGTHEGRYITGTWVNPLNYVRP